MTLLLYKHVCTEENIKDDALSYDNLIDLIIEYKIGGFGRLLFGNYLESLRSKYKENRKHRKK